MRTGVIKLALAAVTISALLAGCSGGSNDKPPANAGNGNKPADAAGNNGAATQKGKLEVMVYDRGLVPQAEGTYEKNRWTEWLNEHGPADVSYVPIPRANPQEKLNVLFASESAPDLLAEYAANNRDSWYGSKMMLPLDELIEEHSVEYKAQLEKYPILRKLGTRADGKLYEVGWVDLPDVNWVFVVRNDWLKNLGLSVPETTEQLLEVARRFTVDDPDGNQKDDTYGISLTGYNGGSLAYMFGVPIASGTPYTVKDDSLERAWDNLQASVEFKKQLYDLGVVDKDFLADTTGDKARRDFVNGKLGFFSTSRVELPTLLPTLKQNVPDAELIAIAYPESPFGSFSPPIQAPAQVPGFINAKAKDPVTAIKYLDFLNQEQTMQTLKWGIEGEHYTLDAQGCPEVLDSNKKTQEVDWNHDYTILSSRDPVRHCDFLDTLDPNDPVMMEFKQIIESARELYLSAERPIPGLTHEAYYPALPNELMTRVASYKENDELMKAIITPNMTVGSAIGALQETWRKSGGDQVDEWYRSWYRDSRDTGVLLKDVYDTLDTLKQ